MNADIAASNHLRQRLLGLPRHRLQETYISILYVLGVGEGLGTGVGEGDLAGVGALDLAGGRTPHHLAHGAVTAPFMFEKGLHGGSAGRGIGPHTTEKEDQQCAQCENQVHNESCHDSGRCYFREDLCKREEGYDQEKGRRLVKLASQIWPSPSPPFSDTILNKLQAATKMTALCLREPVVRDLYSWQIVAERYFVAVPEADRLTRGESRT